jgi:hypothetical protein
MPMIDYKAIADAYEAGGYASIDDAHIAMSSMTVPDTTAVARYNRTRILGELGVVVGLGALSAMHAALIADPALDAYAEQTLLDLIANDEGLDMAHASTQLLLTSWKAASAAETHPLFDALLGLGNITKPVYPGLTRGHIATALDKRARGVI